MNDAEKFGYELVFNEIVYSIINKRTDFSETALIWLDNAKEFFTNVITSLESVVNRPIEGYTHLEKEGQKLSKIIELAGYIPENSSQEDVQNMIKGFKAKRKQLSQLRQNPQEFYKGKDAEELLTISEKIRHLYHINSCMIKNYIKMF